MLCLRQVIGIPRKKLELSTAIVGGRGKRLELVRQ